MKKAKEHAKKNKRNAEQANIPVDQRVHERITCDGCNVSPIVGIRYKCAECPNFDLCSQCEGQGLHDHHTFLKVKTPQGIEVHEPFRAERGCKGKRNKKQDEGLKPVIDAAFEFPQVLEKLTQLGIDPQIAKQALIQHAGNFDLACSQASKEMSHKDDHPKEEEEKEPHHPHWQRHCRRGGFGRGRGGCGRGGNPFRQMF